MPICFALVDDAGGPVLVTPLDEKPKSVADPRTLARVRDISDRPDVSLLFERWSEDWAELAWLRWFGRARLVEPSAARAGALERLRERYEPYRQQALESRPLIVITLERTTSWGALTS